MGTEMRRRRCRVPLTSGVLAIALALAVTAGRSEQEQENAVELVPREDMIDAIIHFAASGRCETRRKVFGAAFDATCKKPDSGANEHMTMWEILDRLPERDLAGLCRRNRIADCEQPREVSKGRQILELDSAQDVEFNSYRAAWSPDGRLLLLDNLNLPAGEVRLLDVASGRLLDPPLHAGPIHDAAWSPDGTLIALSDRRRASPEQAPPVGAIRLYDSSTRTARGSVSAADAGCSLGFQEGMAFTADSKALWVLCSQDDKTAKAIKLKVPELEVVDSFLPGSPIPGWSESYWEEGIVRFAGDLILIARFRSPTPVSGLRSAVQSYSLRTKQPLHPAIKAVMATARLTPDLTGLYIGNELWSTRSGQRVASGVKPNGRYLGGQNRLPRLGMHLEARPQPKSRRSVLAVLDSATGATVQELGPVPTAVVAILVSPSGGRVAVAGFHGIRFYRVNPDAAAAPTAQGR